MSKKRKWLIVGGGSIGRRHLRNLRTLHQQEIEVVEPSVERGVLLAEECKVKVVPSLEAGLAGSPEVAVICSPTRFHLDQAVSCLESGCALFIEKPLADRWEGVDQFLRKVKRRQTPILVGCNFRFHPGLRVLRRLLQEKRFGEVVTLRAEFGYYLPYWHPWEDYRRGYSAQAKLGGGVALDRIHEFDLLRWLGGEFKQLHGRCRNTGSLDIDTEDLVQAEILFKSGAWGSIHIDYLRRSYRCCVDILGTEGFATWDYSKANLVWREKNCDEEKTRGWPRWDANQMYLDELRHFMRVLRGREVAEQDADSAAEILKNVLQIRKIIAT